MHLLTTIAGHAATRGAAPAIDRDGVITSYAQLWERARRIAGGLAGRGVGPGALVAVALPRGADQVATVLGCLIAGAGWVPLDPVYPPERRALILGLAQPALTVMDAGADGVDPAALATAAPLVAAVPTPDDAPGYVVFTSGSTGTPKGAVLPRRALDGFVAPALAAYGITADDRVLQFNALGFDAAVEELVCALAAGACLVPRPAAMLDGHAPALAALAAARITVLDLPTAYWHGLAAALDAPAAAQLGALRTTIIGGEAALAGPARRWLELLPRTRLINTYGPAEATIVATSSDLGAWLAAGAAEAPPIGTPWPGMETDLVDGELWLGGARIANGYLGRDDLTRERFRERDGVRWYRTGDRATRRADGQLIFAGRNDDQVKVRGHRIELGEVEAQLAAEPGVARAAALAPAGDDGVRRLVAFIEPAPGATPQPATLAAALRARLPPYLVPSALRVVARLPLSPNGKVDRAVLAADAARLIVGDAADALLAAFRRAAAAPELDEDDDVFAAGADSLAALGLALDLSRASGRMVTVTDLVRQPTPRAMRAFLAGAAAAATPIPVLPSAANVPAMLVTLRQCRTWAWFGWVATGSSEPYVVGCHLWLSGALDVHALVRAWRRVVARHEPLRVCLPPLAGWRARWPRWAQAALVLNPLCRWVFLRITAQRHRRAAPGELPPTMQVPLADVPLLQAEAAERACVEERPLPDRAPDAVRALLLAHMAEPLREDQAPLARLRLYRAGDGGAHLLSLVVHHGVADGESTVWLKRDLLAFYADELGAGAPPPPLPLAWGDLARWRREQPSTAVVTGWRRLFATCDGDPTLVLPCWRGTPPARAWRRRAALLTAMLDPAASARLRRLAQEQRATLFMVALAGMAAVVRRQVAREVLPIRGALANRERPEAAELCACLTEPAIFAVRADPAATFAGQIEAARQAVLASLALQGAPVETYAALMECTFAQGRLRMRDGNDYPGVFVDVRNGGRGDRAVAGLQVHELHLPEPECDGDLQCTLVDHGDAGIEAWCQFSDDRWDEAGVRSFFTGWLNLLAHAEPGTACAALAERAAGAAPPMISRHALRKRNA